MTNLDIYFCNTTIYPTFCHGLLIILFIFLYNSFEYLYLSITTILFTIPSLSFYILTSSYSPAKRKEIHRPPEKGMNSSNMCIFYKLAISIHKVKMKEKQRMEIKNQMIAVENGSQASKSKNRHPE